MLTPRAWWFLLVLFTLLAVGVVGDVTPLTLLALTLLLWFASEWLLFSVRSRLVVRGVTLRREVRDDRGPVDSLWAGRSFEVRVRLALDSFWGLPYVAAADRVPFGLEQTAGESEADGALWRDQPLEL